MYKLIEINSIKTNDNKRNCIFKDKMKLSINNLNLK